ncbi:sugar transferase [Prochlorococcus marinus str. XMU1401]|uniref:Sugar transferase n=1 Tax=Prochlorococcus marinus str. XMU1401 TaxID=2052594 RepID=A0A8I2BKQ9_PROMR|nr:sugar transferase [Prochlorococcus marinus]MBO8223279.1 sugar transferase [Prochlorococcus marinus str. XMU1401]MCQ9198963.1 sugar transferase [Prochlorococcus marinus XMU1429]
MLKDKKNINYDGIIIDDNLKDVNTLEFKNNILLSNWLGKYLQKYPVDLISNLFFLDKSSFASNSLMQLRIKEVFEKLISMSLIIIFSPLILISSIFIYLEDGLPIFYSQNRNGLFNKKIKITKLRTMKNNAEKDGVQWSKKNDKRITKIGSFIRKIRVDELPQLISVLKGEMSLIGPRPERPEIDLMLSKEIQNYNIRYNLKPGLSGWAQVNYPYGASIQDAKNKLSYDLYYVKNFSNLLDIKILFMTIKLVFNAKGAIAKK